jgi:SpoVK/Ycf46/Vps4 family AAA+-type ATPase
MLPKLASINDKRKIVFLLATNYISGFDAAFSRGGRFDMLVQIMPPMAEEKLANDNWSQFKTCYETLSQDRQADAKPLLEDLTYAKAPKLTTPDLVFEEIKAVHKNCTLNQPNEIDGIQLTQGPTKRNSRGRIRATVSGSASG